MPTNNRKFAGIAKSYGGSLSGNGESARGPGMEKALHVAT